MHLHRTVQLASSSLTSLVCLILAGCSVNAQAGSSSPRAPAHEHRQAKRADSPAKDTTPKTKKRDEPATEKKATTEPKTDRTPTKATEGPAAAAETPLPAGTSRLVVPVQVSLKALSDKLEEELPKTESRDWKRVTKKGKKHEVDVRYKVWRDPIKLSMQGSTVRVVVPLRYASDFRAKTDKPVGKGSFWLTHGESWGTEERQQRLDVTLDLSLSVSENYKLVSHSKLVSMVHGAPPSGNACAKAGVEICIPKKDLAIYVEDEMNEHLGRKIEKALKKGDEKVSKVFDLEKRVQTLWSGLSTPVELQKPKQLNCPTLAGQACTKSAWLAFSPSSIGLSPLGLNGDDVGVRVALEGRLAVTEAKPATKASALPKLQALGGGTAFELATAFDIPIANLTNQLEKALATSPVRLGAASLKFKSASISVTDGAKKAVVLELVTEKDQKLGFATSLDYDAKKQVFGLSKLVPNAATKALIDGELKALDLAALERTIDEHAQIALDKASDSLQKAVASSLGSTLPGKLRLKGTLSELALENFSLTEKAIAARIVLKGPLSVEFTL